MLVLSRHRDESIMIGDDIVITVVDIRGDKVRLGIAAPIEIPVHRQEVYEAIQREQRNRREHVQPRRDGPAQPHGQDGRLRTYRLSLPPRAIALIEDLASKIDGTPADVLSQALALYSKDLYDEGGFRWS